MLRGIGWGGTKFVHGELLLLLGLILLVFVGENGCVVVVLFGVTTNGLAMVDPVGGGCWYINI